ncbi:MAG: hypothetical protein GX318_09410 [Clostridia bacterium]|nr:hypothetical protein [Clostridia bacterium]
MANVGELWQLQETRKKYFLLRAEIKKLEDMGGLEDKEDAVAKAKNDLESIQEKIKSLGRNIRSKEMDCGKLMERREEIQKELYKDNPNIKELSNLQQRLELTREDFKKTEEKVLNLSIELEELEEKEAEVSERLKEVDNQLGIERANLKTKIAGMEHELQDLKTEHDRLSKTIDPGILKIYDQKFKRLSISAVAEVNRGVCAGCNLHLPRYIISDARKNEGLVTCESCGRILYFRS